MSVATGAHHAFGSRSGSRAGTSMMKPIPIRTASAAPISSPMAAHTPSVSGVSTTTTGIAASSASTQRHGPMRCPDCNPATAIAPTHPAITGHCRFIAPIGNIAVATPARATGTTSAPTASSAAVSQRRRTPATTAANASATQASANMYQPSAWNIPACSAPSSGCAPLRHCTM